ncbi:MAG: hypothetical protein JWN77_1497 [Frankiales bacterium]|nr:hypothetical protein [Frankiales bacterium]
MTALHLPRRALVGAVLATSLVGAGVTAFAADGTGSGCPAWTDPKGDATTGGEPTGLASDANLDIVAATAATTATDVVVTVTTDALNAGASDAGDEFGLDLTVAGADLFIAADREVDDSSSAHVGNYGDPTVSEPAKAVFDVKSKTVTITAPLASLKAAAGADVSGKPATALSAYTSNIVPFADMGLFLYDNAATKAALTLGTDCAGGTGAAPAPAESASPSASPSPSSSPSGPPAAGIAQAGLPAPGCNTFPDVKGDATVSPTVGGPGVAETDLDLTGLVLQSTPDALRAYLRVVELKSRPQSFPGHAFYANFTVNKKAVQLIGTAYDPEQLGQAQDGPAAATAGTPAQRSPKTRMTVDATYVPSSLKATFDVKTSIVTLSIPRAELAKAVGGFEDGSVLTKVYGRDSATTPAGGLFVDSTAKDNSTGVTDKDAWTVGDNLCFAPPVPPLSSVGVTKAQFGDSAAVAAKLVDAAGAPVAGKQVTFALGAAKATGTTGADGVAKAALLVKEKAGSRTLTLTSDDTTSTSAFTVLVEKTALKATGSKGAVTATLSDDDRKPVAGQVVTFTSGGKKVTAKTDGKGVAKAAGFAPGSAVTATYAGVSGQYAGSKASAKA